MSLAVYTPHPSNPFYSRRHRRLRPHFLPPPRLKHESQIRLQLNMMMKVQSILIDISRQGLVWKLKAFKKIFIEDLQPQLHLKAGTQMRFTLTGPNPQSLWTGEINFNIVLVELTHPPRSHNELSPKDFPLNLRSHRLGSLILAE